jgi:hypothetical protein
MKYVFISLATNECLSTQLFIWLDYTTLSYYITNDYPDPIMAVDEDPKMIMLVLGKKYYIHKMRLKSIIQKLTFSDINNQYIDIGCIRWMFTRPQFN